MNEQQEYILRVLEEREVGFVRLWFPDILGGLKTVSVSPGEIERVFSEGLGFDGSAIEGFSRVYESDLLALGDENTFSILPWHDSYLAARMFCHILTPDGEPAALDCRQVLKRVVESAAEMGFTLQAQSEVEFYILKVEGQEISPVDKAGYFDSVAGSGHQDFRRISVNMLEQLGIAVEFSHHEAGPGQYEIDLSPADVLGCADNLMTLRAVVKEVAIGFGCRATFMPKPFAKYPGSGLHTHLSLFEGDRNVFYEPGGLYRLSKTAKHFMAGLLRYAREIAAVTNQFVNSYKRLWAGGEAPSVVCWGHNNRSALLRVPIYKPSQAQSCRLEYRALDAGANPYLAFALVLAAGLRGIEGKYPLPEESEDNVWDLSEMERKALGLASLPKNLEAALELMEGSEFVIGVLGQKLLGHFLANKRRDWHDYRQQVSDWERKTNLSRP